MGKLSSGITGPTTGKIANLTTYMYNEQNVIRSIGKRRKPFSVAELTNQERTSVVAGFLRPLKSFIKLTFKPKDAGKKNHPYNDATSYNKKNATKGELPDISIDFTKARIAQGDLTEALNPKVIKTNGGLQFTWEVKDQSDWDRNRDQVVVLAYIPDKNDAFGFPSGTRRDELSQFLPIMSIFAGKEIETYIAFVSDDRTQISNSQYLGKIQF